MSAAGQTVDRRELLAQQLEALEPEPVSATETVEATSALEPEANDGTKGERARDEAGKFVAKDKAEPELPLEASPAAQAPAAPAPAVEPPLWERPPASWKPEFREPWKTVDPKVREYFWKREEEMSAGILSGKEKIRLADEVTKVAEPYMNTIRGLGVDLPRAVQGLMYADNILRTAPRDQAKQYLLELAKTYGIQLGDGVQDPNAAPVDPNYHALYNELNSIRGEVKSWQQQQKEAQEAAQLAEINRFKLKAEFFDEALPTMIQLLNGGAAVDVEDAYNKAIRLDENLSGKVQARTQAQTVATQSAAADKAAKAAKAAAVSVKTSTPGAQTTTKAQDRRAVLEEAFSNIEGRL